MGGKDPRYEVQHETFLKRVVKDLHHEVQVHNKYVYWIITNNFNYHNIKDGEHFRFWAKRHFQFM